MPKYVYHCDECDEQFEAYHGMNDNLDYCELCDSQDSVKRIPQMLFIKRSQGKKKVGSVVKEYVIERFLVLVYKKAFIKIYNHI